MDDERNTPDSPTWAELFDMTLRGEPVHVLARRYGISPNRLRDRMLREQHLRQFGPGGQKPIKVRRNRGTEEQPA